MCPSVTTAPEAGDEGHIPCRRSGFDTAQARGQASERFAEESRRRKEVPLRRSRRGVITPPKRSGGWRKPTAVAEGSRGLTDALKVRPDLWIGVQISLYLLADLILGLAFEAREEVIHVRVSY